MIALDILILLGIGLVIYLTIRFTKWLIKK